ncbi:MAG: hypothetical protein FJ267_14450 [Planctomycetes bacterium]|nr:hypothetical protein [Planctomycetota bacterium]
MSGCQYFQSSRPDSDADLADLEDDFGEPSDESSTDGDRAESLSSSSDLPSTKLESSADGSSSTRSSRRDSPDALALRLQVGDKFPFTKRIEQRLTQADKQGVSVYHSMIEMLLSLTVEEIRDGNKRLQVAYHRVRYAHDIAGKKTEFSSDKPSGNIPPEALAYSGLANNGFSFWIGPDNRIANVVGFSNFLQRCVQDIPSDQREIVLKQIQGQHDEGDLADFVDDSIGLLPYSQDPRHPDLAVQVGSSWDLKPRATSGAIPLHVNTHCVVKELTEREAEISLIGSVSGDHAPVVVRDGDREMKVFVRGGHSSGTCTIDRKTGLPTNSKVNRLLEMAVTLADGSEIQQRKETFTTISAFLNQNSSLPQDGLLQSSVRQENRGASRVEQTGFSQTTRTEPSMHPRSRNGN